MKWVSLLEGENIYKDAEQWNPFSLFTAERISPTSKKIEKSDAGWWKKFAWCLPFEKVVLRTSSASVINQSSTQHLFFPPIGSAIYVGVLSAPEAKEANGTQLVYIYSIPLFPYLALWNGQPFLCTFLLRHRRAFFWGKQVIFFLKY
jgi:hypothetical protein